MLAFMWWLVIGLCAGLVARLLAPGRQPMGWLMTMGLGLAGSFIGGFISTLIFGTDPADPGFHTAGFLMSTVGAIILLVAYLAFSRRTGPRY
jgi:uncharacterized membrane protein YeaQ/YmgE (transglycosylase-associated protein family)